MQSNAETIFPPELISLIGALGEKLIVRNWFLGGAESCTGGLLAALCTEIPGSSMWFEGAVVSYSNQVKESLLGVPEETLAHFGAVSKQAVEVMALRSASILRVDMAYAVSGIAGPSGGTPEKPIGTVWIAAAVPAAASFFVHSELLHLEGNRSVIRLQAVAALVNMLYSHV